MSNSLQPHEVWHTKIPFTISQSLLKFMPLNQWCHPTISSSVGPFSSCPQSMPASGSFPMHQLFTSGSQSIGTPASASVLPMNIQGWFLLGLTGLILLSKTRNSQESSSAPWFKSINSSAFSLLYGPTLKTIHDYWRKQVTS